MKSTNHFKETIQNHLEQRAATDELFADSFAKPDKNLDDCITSILNTVQKSGCNGFTDDEIFGLAAHFYLENNVEIGKPIECDIIVNHTVELTAEEKEQARKDAIQQAQDEAYKKYMQPKNKPIIKQQDFSSQKSLFDL